MSLPIPLGKTGDVIALPGGVYDPTEFNVSGVTYKAADPAKPPVFTGSGVGATGLDAGYVSANGVTLEGLVFRGASRAGLSITGENCTVRDIECADNGSWGLFTGNASDLLIEGGKFHGSKVEHGIYISGPGGSTKRVTIRGAECYQCGKSGIQFNDGATDCLVENCYIHDTGLKSTSGINLLAATVNSVFRNNRIERSGSHGIAIASPSRGNTFEGNKFSAIRGKGIWIANTDNIFRGNVYEDATRVAEFAGNPKTFNLSEWQAKGFDGGMAPAPAPPPKPPKPTPPPPAPAPPPVDPRDAQIDMLTANMVATQDSLLAALDAVTMLQGKIASARAALG